MNFEFDKSKWSERVKVKIRMIMNYIFISLRQKKAHVKWAFKKILRKS